MSANDYTPTTEEETDIRNLIKAAVFAQNEPMPLEYKAEIASKSLASFDRWLAEVKAEAWEEGYETGSVRSYGDSPNNPYRQGETE